VGENTMHKRIGGTLAIQVAAFAAFVALVATTP
jgi:hypothetical protein